MTKRYKLDIDQRLDNFSSLNSEKLACHVYGYCGYVCHAYAWTRHAYVSHVYVIYVYVSHVYVTHVYES